MPPPWTMASARSCSYPSMRSSSTRALFARSFGTTTTPSSSPITMSPGNTTSPPQDTGRFTRPGPSFSGLLGVTAAAKVGRPTSRKPVTSLTAPSVTRPARPLCLASRAVWSPQTACPSWAPVATTITSPLDAIESAFQTTRLSPGGASTVIAVPHIGKLPTMGLTRLDIAPDRPSASPMCPVGDLENRATIAASGRSNSVFTTNPGLDNVGLSSSCG